MNETLGLVDTLEAMLLDGSTVPFSSRIMVDEKDMLQLIDKIRLSIKSGGRAAQTVMDLSGSVQVQTKKELNEPRPESLPEDSVVKQQQSADKLSRGAQEYADQVMANLQLMVTKMQTNLVKFEKSIEEGRQAIETLQNKKDKQQ